MISEVRKSLYILNFLISSHPLSLISIVPLRYSKGIPIVSLGDNLYIFEIFKELFIFISNLKLVLLHIAKGE